MSIQKTEVDNIFSSSQKEFTNKLTDFVEAKVPKTDHSDDEYTVLSNSMYEQGLRAAFNFAKDVYKTEGTTLINDVAAAVQSKMRQQASTVVLTMEEKEKIAKDISQFKMNFLISMRKDIRTELSALKKGQLTVTEINELILRIDKNILGLMADIRVETVV